MFIYLRSIENPTVYRYGADHLEIPFSAPEGWEWIEGHWEGLTLYSESSIQDQLKAIFESQELEIQVAFYAFVPQVLTALDNNRPDIAQAIIQATAVPTELEAVKTNMLEVFE